MELHRDDVFCCVKAYMRDERTKLTPVLALPPGIRRDLVTQVAPTTVETMEMAQARAMQLVAIAVVQEDMGHYNLPRCRSAPCCRGASR